MVQLVKLNSANYLFDNKNSEEREYDIQTNVQAGADNVMQYGDSGSVSEKGNPQMKCSFTVGSVGNINYSFYNTPIDEQVSIIHAIEVFMNEVNVKLSEMNN